MAYQVKFKGFEGEKEGYAIPGPASALKQAILTEMAAHLALREGEVRIYDDTTGLVEIARIVKK